MMVATLRLHLPGVQPRGRGAHPLRSLPPLSGEPRARGRGRSARVRAKEDGEEDNSGSMLDASTDFLDSLVDARKRAVREKAQREREMRADLEAMRAAGSPPWALNIVEWLVKFNTDIYEGEVRRLAKLEADQQRYVAEWEAWERTNKEQGPLTVEDFAEVVVTGQDAPEQATAAILAAFIGAAAVSWAASLFGNEVGVIFPDPTLPSAAEASAWAAWTVPYAGATAAAAAFAGPWVANRGTFRFAATEDSFYAALHPTAVLSLAAALAYSQGVIYQGVWLLAFYRMFAGGGVDAGLDPAAADDAVVAQAMGSLVASPAAPVLRLIAAPAAVAATAALEAGVWAARVWAANVLQTVASGDADAAGGGPAAGDAKERPQAPSLAAIVMSEQEFWATTGRVFASSAWLGAETLATRNLWWAVATGAVGLGIAMGVAQVRAGRGGGDER